MPRIRPEDLQAAEREVAAPDAANREREARLGRSLRRLGHQLLPARGGGYMIGDGKGTIVRSGTVFSPTLSLDDVQAWIEEHVKTKG